MACSRRQNSIILTIGSILVALSLFVLIAFPPFYAEQLEKQTTLANGTVLFDVFEDLPLPIYQKLYFFNISNRDEFLMFGIPLEVKEVGPYTFRSHWVKEEIKWNNGTVSFREKKSFYFDPEKSVGTEDDFIYSLNGPLIFAGSFIESKKPNLQKWAGVLFELFNERLVIKKTIRQLAFEGYKDLILKYGKIVQQTPFRDGMFAWLYDRNATDDGEFVVDTGERNRSMLNFVRSWNGSDHLHFWKEGSQCNMINGTNAEIGPPIKENQANYTFFQPIFCRSMTFDYAGEVKHLGIESKRFKNTKKVFANKYDNPDNYCFEDVDNPSPPLPSGVMNISSCQFDAPVLLSFPHFYLANESYLDNVIGIEPNASIHESYIDVEPITGVSISLAVRFQVNVYLHQNKFYKDFENITSAVYPIFWMEMLAEIDDNLASLLSDGLKKPKVLVYSIFGTVLILSVLVLVVGFFKRPTKTDDEERKSLLKPGVKNYSTGLPNSRENLAGSDEHIGFVTPRSAASNTSPVFQGKRSTTDVAPAKESSMSAAEKTSTRPFFERNVVP